MHLLRGQPFLAPGKTQVAAVSFGGFLFYLVLFSVPRHGCGHEHMNLPAASRDVPGQVKTCSPGTAPAHGANNPQIEWSCLKGLLPRILNWEWGGGGHPAVPCHAVPCRAVPCSLGQGSFCRPGLVINQPLSHPPLQRARDRAHRDRHSEMDLAGLHRATKGNRGRLCQEVPKALPRRWGWEWEQAAFWLLPHGTGFGGVPRERALQQVLVPTSFLVSLGRT